MKWCVRVDESGQFRSATTIDDSRTVFSIADWHRTDRAAAEQFDPLLSVQRRFMAATGLDRRDAVNGSLLTSLT